MRVVTFNIQHGLGATDDAVQLGRLQDAVRGLAPDVLCLQEVDRCQERSGFVDQTAGVADAMGAVDHRFVAALTGTPGLRWTAATGDETPEAAAYGVALLSRHRVRRWHVVRLAAVVPGEEPRVAVAAEIDSPRGRVTVVNTHLSYLRGSNSRQLRLLVRALAPLPRPLLLTGDLNLRPRAVQRLTHLRPLASARTFPAVAPSRQIDHVLLDGVLPGLADRPSASASRTAVSDHLALSVEL